jgi:hypothetical protein
MPPALPKIMLGTNYGSHRLPVAAAADAAIDDGFPD